jgi:hypothetical protein
MVRTCSGALKERAPIRALCAALVLTAGCDMSAAQQSWAGPRTEAEASGYARTSTSAQVERFVAECVARSPLLRTVKIGESTRKKPLLVTLAADPPVATLEEARKDPRLKVLVMANIHAGEVEGKEAVQVCLREIAQGRHARTTTPTDTTRSTGRTGPTRRVRSRAWACATRECGSTSTATTSRSRRPRPRR